MNKSRLERISINPDICHGKPCIHGYISLLLPWCIACVMINLIHILES